MELLLNLLWLALALPGVWLWRRQSLRARNWQRPGWVRALLLLGCALVLLFPVVSASDDLNAMRAEMDEPSKPAVKQGPGYRSGTHVHSSSFLPQATALAWSPHPECCGLVSDAFVLSPRFSSSGRKASRAPPSNRLA